MSPTDSLSIPLTLAQWIEARLVQSFNGPATVLQWIGTTAAQDPDLFQNTVAQCPAIKGDVDAGILCPIGVVLVQSSAAWDVFQDHVELVWGYDQFGAILRLHVYDCNNEGNDSIIIELDTSSSSTPNAITTNGTDGPTPKHIRGFFRLPYDHVDPSPAYFERPWEEIGHANDVVAMAAINGKLFCATRDNRLWWRDPIP